MSDEVAKDELPTEEIETDQYLIFAVESREYGFQAMRVQEISQVLATTQVPNAPSYVEGVANLRGRIASVVNLRKKFGFEAREHDEDTRVIVAEFDGYPIGVIVDSVEEVIKIPDELVQKLPESTTTAASREYMAGVGMLDSRLIILLEMDKVLTGTELVEADQISQAVAATQTAETPEQTTEETNKMGTSEPALEKAHAKETSGQTEREKPDTSQPADTGKRRKGRGAG